MTGRRTASVLGALALLGAGALAGCAPDGPDASAARDGAASATTATAAPTTTPRPGGDQRRSSLRQLRERAGIAVCPRGSDAAARGGGLPDLTLDCLGGGHPVRLAGLRGKPTVLNVWAQWCGPCRDEAPHLQALYERAGSRVRVIGIDYDDPRPGRALAFARALGLRYPQLADPDKSLLAPFRLLVGIPATAFVDADGRLVHVAHKPYRTEAELVADVRTYLRVRL